MRRIFPLLSILFLCLAALPACGEKETVVGHELNCTPMLEAFYGCGYAVTFDDLEAVGIQEAWESCQGGYGNMWREFIHCYNESETCGEFADCVPEHGFFTDGEDRAGAPLDDDTQAGQ